MHSYGVDTSERIVAPLILSVVSVTLAWAVSWALREVTLPAPWLIGPPSALGFFGLLMQLFDKRLWRTALVHKLGITKIPNLGGSWVGYVESTSGAPGAKQEATLTITQTWSHMTVALQTGGSVSKSRMAMFETEDPLGTMLSYEYLNEPRVIATETMHIHRGTARLVLAMQQGKIILSGEYYTGRDRRTYGVLFFERQG